VAQATRPRRPGSIAIRPHRNTGDARGHKRPASHNGSEQIPAKNRQPQISGLQSSASVFHLPPIFSVTVRYSPKQPPRRRKQYLVDCLLPAISGRRRLRHEITLFLPLDVETEHNCVPTVRSPVRCMDCLRRDYIRLACLYFKVRFAFFHLHRGTLHHV